MMFILCQRKEERFPPNMLDNVLIYFGLRGKPTVIPLQASPFPFTWLEYVC